jgi:hypothetical protein
MKDQLATSDPNSPMKHLRFPILIAAFLAAAAGASVLPKDQRRETIRFVEKLQNPDGGFRAGPAAGPSSASATTAGLRALEHLDGPKGPRKAAARFIESLALKDGGFPDIAGGTADARTTAQGLMAAVEAESSLRKDLEGKIRAFLGSHAKTLPEIYISAAAVDAAHLKSPVAKEWIAAFQATRTPDGGFGGTPAEQAGAAVTILRLGGKLENRKAVVRSLLAAQNPDGGWSGTGTASDMASVYRVMRALYMLNAEPDLDRVIEFVRRNRNSDGGYGLHPGEPSATSSTYYASIVQDWINKMAARGDRFKSLERGGAYTGFPRLPDPGRLGR